MIDENGRDKNESKGLWTVENKILMKGRGGNRRGLGGEWMVSGGGEWREGGGGSRVLSGEERESRNERYIASGKQKTIVTLPPITHFNLKQQIFFTQLISTHWSRGLGWSRAFMCSCRCKAYTHFSSLSFLSFLSLSQALAFFFFFSSEITNLHWNGQKHFERWRLH